MAMYSANTQAYEAYNFYVDAQPGPLPLVVSPDFQLIPATGIANTRRICHFRPKKIIYVSGNGKICRVGMGFLVVLPTDISLLNTSGYCTLICMHTPISCLDNISKSWA